MKKWIVFLLAAMLLVNLAACGVEQKTDDPTDYLAADTVTPETPATGTDTTEGSANDMDSPETEAENGSESTILIAYFTAAENSDVDAVSSASVVMVDGVAKGSVQAVADMIRDETGGDLFSIQTEFDYPGDIGELIDYADGEQERNERPVLVTHIENLEDYDVIFIGYPNWWYDMPMAMYTFFEEYDFSGKTIIPFNTHRGSRFSSTISTIQELEPEATVVEDGFTFPGDDAADAAEDVAEWLDSLNY